MEVPLHFTVEAPPGSRNPDVGVRGRIDRLERNSGGGLLAVDLKTSASPVSEADALVHPQLALYQLGLHSGAIEGEGDDATAAGGALLYLAAKNKAGYAVRTQDPLDPETAETLRARVLDAGAAQLGPGYLARTGPWCEQCPVASSCPAVDEGTRVV